MTQIMIVLSKPNTNPRVKSLEKKIFKQINWMQPMISSTQETGIIIDDSIDGADEAIEKIKKLGEEAGFEVEVIK